MNILLDRMNAHWVRYSNYEWKPDEKNNLYLTPTKDAEPEIRCFLWADQGQYGKSPRGSRGIHVGQRNAQRV